jgi:hypothetical protein
VKQPERSSDRNDKNDRKQCRQLPRGQKDGKKNPQQGEHRPDRKIDPSGDDDPAEADAENAVDADQPREVLKVCRAEKTGIQKCENDAKDDKEHECSKFFPHR